MFEAFLAVILMKFDYDPFPAASVAIDLNLLEAVIGQGVELSNSSSGTTFNLPAGGGSMEANGEVTIVRSRYPPAP